MSKYGFLLETIKGRFASAEVSNERKNICDKCPLYSNGTCSSSKTDTAVKTFEYFEEIRYEGVDYPGCGCIIRWKSVLLNEICPLGKWGKENGNN